MALIRTLTISTATFERMKEKFYGFRQTDRRAKHNYNQFDFVNLQLIFVRCLEKLIATEMS